MDTLKNKKKREFLYWALTSIFFLYNHRTSSFTLKLYFSCSLTLHCCKWNSIKTDSEKLNPSEQTNYNTMCTYTPQNNYFNSLVSYSWTLDNVAEFWSLSRRFYILSFLIVVHPVVIIVQKFFFFSVAMYFKYAISCYLTLGRYCMMLL